MCRRFLPIVALALAACSPQQAASQTPTSTRTLVPPTPPEATIAASPSTSAPLWPRLVTAAGLTLEASEPRRTDQKSSVVICYPLPTAEDWLVFDASLTVADQTAPMDASAPVEEFTSPVVAGQKVCRTSFFPLALPPPPFNFSVQVDRIETSNPIVDPNCKAAQETLDRLDTGVMLFCEDTLGYVSFDISWNPKGLALKEVQQMVHYAFYGVVSGPWVFEGQVP